MIFIVEYFKTLPTWYSIFALYLLSTLPAFIFLKINAEKEIEEVNKKITKEEDKASLDNVYLYIAALFYPLIAIFSFMISLITIIIDVIYHIVDFIIDILYFIFSGICFLLTLPFMLIKRKKGAKEKMNEQKIMTKDNVLLYEKHDVTTTEALSGEDGKTILIHGAKVFRVIKPENGEFNVLAQYLSETDSIDLSSLHDYVGWFMVSVDRDNYDHDKFVWNCVELGEGTENSEMFTINNPRACTEEEVKMLNELFPEYYDHAF